MPTVSFHKIGLLLSLVAQLISRRFGILLSESDGGPEQSGCKPEYTE